MSIIQQMAEEPIKMDMTPMIDVVFQLLIFFMCSLNFKSAEGMLPSHLPKDVGVFSAPSKRNPEEPIYIKLIQDPGKGGTVIWLGGESLAGKDKFNKLYIKIKRIADKAGNTVPALIDPDIETPFESVIAALNVCRKVSSESGEKLEIKFSAKALESKK